MKTQDFCYIEVDKEMYVAKDDGFCKGHGFMEPATKGIYTLKLACPKCGRTAQFEKCVELDVLAQV